MDSIPAPSATCGKSTIEDAQHLEDGDVARVILPFRSSGLHGLWIDDDEVDFG
jgi:carotenoid cleavage dioxygenase-like enzyme